ncbi:DUF3592 domain-containing protein, partial [Microbulbifer mangrovi]|uniref:DUF3592 domain-containing protein n=1 Tax=Microbulbifer mangrovi TaxID=927787 RepID=UPI003B83947A
DVEYEYVVNGYTYTSSKVSYSASGSRYSRKVLRKFPEGKKVTVYFDSLNPRYAVLEMGSLDSRVLVQAGI